MLEALSQLLPLSFGEALGVVWLAGEVLAVLTVPSVLLRRRGRPYAAISWLLALFAIPPLALLGWWVLGRNRLEKRGRRRQAASEALASQLSETARQRLPP
ncbi:MAG TPA: hypothetical protein DEA08_16115, partial [Planctomycetes bacterium]|nr:hypothetical protein [Planctomycetota bacterium]